MDKVEEVKKRKERERLASMTDEEKAIEEAKWKKIEDTDPFKFYGNMGQPETAQEFKNRYGVWPPGYDENGNKISDSDEEN